MFEAVKQEDILMAAERCGALVAARADEVEAARRLPADMAKTLASEGLFRILVPRDVGGLECDPISVISILRTLAAGDASVGWCVMIGATTGLVSAYLPKDIATRIFADPGAITGGVFAPLGKAVRQGDHFRVSGRWAWASGSANCAWLTGGAKIFGEDGPELTADGRARHRMMLFMREDVELIDTWHAQGLKGTGSGDMAVENVLVPQAHSVSLSDDRPRADGALYAFPPFGLLAMGVAAVALGNAHAALTDIADLMRQKKMPGGRKTMAERAMVQVELAQATAALRAADAYLEQTVADAWEKAQNAGSLSLADRANVRLAATHAVRVSAETTRIAYDMGGGSAVYLDSPLQRRFRDGHTMTQHIMVNPTNFETTGRVLLGVSDEVSTL